MTTVFPANPLGVKVELNLNGTWTDITAYVRLSDLIQISGVGRPNWSAGFEPSECTLTLDNRTGRFSPKNALGAYYPYIQRNTRLRVSVDSESATSVAYSGYRFHGEVAEWPPTADISGSDRYASITAYGIWRRLSRAGTSIGSAYVRYAQRLTSVAGFWPMEDGAGATSFASGLADGNDMAVSSGTVSPAASSVFPGSNALPSLNGAVLAASVSTASGPDTNVFRFPVFVPSGGDTAVTATTSTLAVLATEGTVASLEIGFGSQKGGGPFTVKGFNSSHSQLFSGTVTADIWGIPILVSASLVQSGGNVNWSLDLILPGTSVSYGSASGSVAGTVDDATSVTFNPDGVFQGTAVGQGIVTYDDPALADAADALGGHQGETALDRFTRICAEEGITAETTGSSSVAMGPQYDGTLAAVLQTIEDSDRGFLYESRDQLALGYRAWDSLVDQSPAATFDYSAHQLGATPATTYDDANIVNDVTLNNYDGYSYRLTLGTGALSVQDPPNGVGDYPGQPVNVNLQASTEATVMPLVAKRVLFPGVVDELRVPNLTANLSSPEAASLFADVPAVGPVGDYLAVSNPPSWLTGSTSEQIALGYTETLGSGTWTITFNTVPEAAYESAFAPGTQSGARAVGNPVTGSQTGSNAITGAQIGGGAVGLGQVNGTVLTIGGIHTTIDSSAPADPALGDLWIDSGNGYQLKRWNGASWDAVTWDGGVVLAPGTVTGAQLDAGITARSLGGITTTIAGSAPGSPVTGDIWIDFSAGYQIKRWDGSAWAAVTFDASDVLGAGTITSAELANLAVTAAKIANGTITTTQLDSSVTARALGGVTTTIAASAPGSPVTGDIWIDTGNGGQLNRWSGSAWTAVSWDASSVLSAGTIIGSLIAASTITGGNIAASTITAANIAADTITASQVAAGAIGTDELAANAVTAAKIAANTITASQIAAGTITSAEIAADTIAASNIAAGAIGTSELAANAVTAAKIAAGTITSNEIAANAITSSNIAANAITAGLIAADAINGKSITAASIGTSTLVAGSITSSEIESSTYVIDDQTGGVFLVYSQTNTVTTLNSGSGNWTAPAGTLFARVQEWGGGGGGGGGQNPPGGDGAGGGGGGEYAEEPHLAVTPGSGYPYSVGAGGGGGSRGAGGDPTDGGAGGDTTFTGDSVTVTAHGGEGGKTVIDDGFGGTGGFTSANTIRFSGGNGGFALLTTGGGGGGGSGGPSSAGNDGGGGNDNAGGAGGAAVTGGGAGGHGDSGDTAGHTPSGGANGSAPGGGGGGGGTDGTNDSDGHAGAAGKIVVTAVKRTLILSIAAVAGTDAYGNSYPKGVGFHGTTSGSSSVSGGTDGTFGITGNASVSGNLTVTGSVIQGTPPVYHADATGNLSSFTTEADVPGASVSVTVHGSDSTVVVTGVFDAETAAVASADIIGFLNWNGSDRSEQALLLNTAASSIRATITQTWVITGVTAGTYTAKLRASSTSTGASAVRATHTGITAVVYESN